MRLIAPPESFATAQWKPKQKSPYPSYVDHPRFVHLQGSFPGLSRSLWASRETGTCDAPENTLSASFQIRVLYRPRALFRAHLPIVDQPLAIDVCDAFLSQISLQGGKSCRFAAARRFACLAHIKYVQINWSAKSLSGETRVTNSGPVPDQPASQPDAPGNGHHRAGETSRSRSGPFV